MKPYYEQDGITIYHGDCLEVLPCVEFDAILTDPPYGIEYRQPRACNGRMSVLGDREFSMPRPAVPFVIWGANNAPGFHDCGWLVWDKGRYGADLFGDAELAACSETKKIHLFRNRWDRNHGRGWTGTHPTEKPVPLMRWALQFLPSGRICDPYMGSGAALIAAMERGWKAIGIEIEERYCEIAAKRLAQTVMEF